MREVSVQRIPKPVSCFRRMLQHSVLITEGFMAAPPPPTPEVAVRTKLCTQNPEFPERESQNPTFRHPRPQLNAWD